MSAKSMIIGVVSGLVAGAVVGVILAPQSGEETRQKIADSARDLKKKIKNLSGKSLEELTDLQDIFKSEISGLSDDVRERILNLIKHIKASTYMAAQDIEKD